MDQPDYFWRPDCCDARPAMAQIQRACYTALCLLLPGYDEVFYEGKLLRARYTEAALELIGAVYRHQAEALMTQGFMLRMTARMARIIEDHKRAKAEV